jgi:polyhydroxyalkanoate synthesis regulator phasin
MQDAWRAYLELALGVTEASRKRAERVARDLLGRGEATAAQLQTAAEQLVVASRANREGLARLVRYEVERALNAVGLVTADELAGLTARLRDLERRVDERVGVVPAGPASGPTVQAGAVARKPAAKKPAKKQAAKKPAGKQAAPKQAAKKPAGKKAAPKKATGQSTHPGAGSGTG